MTLSLPSEIVDQARREREESALSAITANIDKSVRDGFNALQGVAGQAVEAVAPVVRLLEGGDLKIPTLDDLTPQFLRDQYAPKPAPAQPAQQQPGMQIGSVTLQDGRQQPGPSMRPGETLGDVSMANGSLRDWARAEAQRLGIDPDIAERVAMSEGGFDDPVRQSDVVYQGQREQSYGPYQLNVTGGLGNQAIARGIDPRNPAHARAAVTFALEHAARNGWGNFHGAAQVGIGQWDGIGQAPVQGPRMTTPMAAEQTPAARGQQASGFDVGSTLERYAGGTYTFGGGRDQNGLGVPGARDTDCSGFVSSVWREQGIAMPAHTDAAYEQLRGLGAAQVSERDAQPGDVVFYMGAGYGGNVTYHMGIYAGPGQVLDASSRGGQGVRIRPLTHAGGPEDIVILRDPRVNGRVDQRRAEAPPEIQPTGIAESPLGERLAATGGASLNAGASPPPAPSPVAPGSAPTAAGGAPPAPWETAGAGAGGQMFMKENDETAPMLGPGDGGFAPATSTPSAGGQSDLDIRQQAQATQAPVYADPTVSDPAYNQSPTGLTYGPVPLADVAEGPPTYDYEMANGGEPTGNGTWTEMPVRPMEAQRQEPQFVEGNMPDVSGGLKPVWDAAGRVIGYVQQAVDDLVNPRAVPGYGQVTSTAGEPDYVPPTTSRLERGARGAADFVVENAERGLRSIGQPNWIQAARLVGEFTEPMGGAPRQINRLQQIEQHALEFTGSGTGDNMRDIFARKRAVEDPRWRQAFPDLAEQYDQLQMDLGLNVMGQAGDAAGLGRGFQRATNTASQGAARVPVMPAGEGGVTIGRELAQTPFRERWSGNTAQAASGELVERAPRAQRGTPLNNAVDELAAEFRRLQDLIDMEPVGTPRYNELSDRQVDVARLLDEASSAANRAANVEIDAALSRAGADAPGIDAEVTARTSSPASDRSLPAPGLSSALVTPGASPGPRGASVGTRLATDAGNALAGSMVGAVAPADTPEERLRNTALGAAGFPIAGRLMRRAGGALGTPGIGPNGGRPAQRTVEWLAEQIDYTKRVLDDLDPATEGELIGQVQDRLGRLQSEWVDAVNARRSLEPRIRSEVGRRVNELPIDERTASDYAGIGRERVSPEAGVPTTVDDTPRSPGLNSAPAYSGRGAGIGTQAAADVGASLQGGVVGAAAGYGMPADSEEQRRQNALTFGGAGMLGMPIAGRVVGRGMRGAGAGTRAGIVPPHVARTLEGAVRPPTPDSAVGQAALKSGGRVTDEGLILPLARSQNARQIGQDSGRGGVFYEVVSPDQQARYASKSGKPSDAYLRGRPVQMRGDTLIRNPLVVNASTGEVASGASTLKGDAGLALVELEQVFPSSDPLYRPTPAERDAALPVLQDILRRAGGDPADAEAILKHQPNAFEIRTAVRENALSSEARRNGHDAIIALDPDTGGIREVMDIRERSFPSRDGEPTALYPRFTSPDAAQTEDAAWVARQAASAQAAKTRAASIDADPAVVAAQRQLDTANQAVQDVFDGAHSGALTPEQFGAALDAASADAQAAAEALRIAKAEAARNAGQSSGQFSALPFDPASAAMGGAAGAMSEGEDGEQGDPLRTAAGILLAGVGGGMSPGARRALQKAMDKAEALKAAGRADDAARVVDDALRRTVPGYDPRLSREPALPGMEPPRRVPGDAGPGISNEPNRAPVLGDVPPSAIDQRALPGMDPVRDAQAPGPVGQSMALTPEQRTARASAALEQFPQARNWYERARMRNEAQMQRTGVEPQSPLRWLMDLVGTVSYSSMLGPGTMSVNLFTGALEPLWAMPKELLRGAGRAVQQRNLSALREPLEMAGGAVHGMTRLGEALIDLAKSRGAYAPNPDFPMLSARTADPMARLLVQALEAPGKVWSALPDAIFGTISKHAGEAREAAQIATNKGLKGAEWKAEVTRLLEDARAVGRGELPTSTETQRVVDAGDAYAKRQSYRDELGTIGRKAEKVAKLGGLPVLGTWASPFFRTPWNAALAQAEKSPIGFAMNRQASRFDKHYDAILGTAAILGLAEYARQGAVTGSGPTDPKERELLQQKGWQPYSVLVGNTYVPTRMFAIFEGPLNAAGELHDAMAYRKQDADERANVTEAAQRIGKLIRQNPYALSGLVSLMELPSQGVAGFAAEQITRVTPLAASARTIGMAGDASERTTDRGKGVPLEDEIIQRWQLGVGARSGLPVAQDAFGQPKANERPGGWAAFPKMRNRQDSPEADIFLEAGIKIGDPKSEMSISRSSLIPSMPLKPSERRLWDQKRGDELLQAAREIAADPEWATAPKEIKQRVLRRVMDTAAKIADNEVKAVIGDDEINRRVDAEAAKKAS